jgi:hypothetical protein
VKLQNVGNIIATRTLVVDQDEGVGFEVTVILGQPQQSPGSSDCYCPYQIKGVGSEEVNQRYGVDRFQALQIALSAIGVQLEVLNKELHGRLRWDCGEKGDLGFPTGLF